MCKHAGEIQNTALCRYELIKMKDLVVLMSLMIGSALACDFPSGFGKALKFSLIIQAHSFAIRNKLKLALKPKRRVSSKLLKLTNNAQRIVLRCFYQ